jgi:hypothetical protein
MHRGSLASCLLLFACSPPQTVTAAELEELKQRVQALEEAPPTDLSDYAKKSELPELSDYAKKTDLPDLTDYATRSDLDDYAHQADLEAIGEVVSKTSTKTTPSASGVWQSMSDDVIHLTPGRWLLGGEGHFSNDGASNPGYTATRLAWSEAPGDNSAGTPSELGAIAVAGFSDAYVEGIGTGSYADMPAPTVVVQVTADTDVYLVPYARMATASYSRVTVYLFGVRLEN